MTTFLSDEDDDVSEEIIPFAAQYVGLLKVGSAAGGRGRWAREVSFCLLFVCLFVQHLNVTDDERQKLQVGVIWMCCLATHELTRKCILFMFACHFEVHCLSIPTDTAAGSH